MPPLDDRRARPSRLENVWSTLRSEDGPSKYQSNARPPSEHLANFSKMSVPETVEPQWVAANLGNIKLLDATYTMKPKMDPNEFKAKYYGKFGVMMHELKNQEYLAEHITGAAHFNADIAYYPTENERFALYDSKDFEQYVRRLGVNVGDHLVIYSRGPNGGIPFAARAWWTFRLYGHNTVSVMNGGLEAWKAITGVVKSGEDLISPGNWEAKPLDKTSLASFEEIPFDNLGSVVYLDGRPKELWTGKEPLGYPNSSATGSRVKGAKHFPLTEVIGPKGYKKKTDVDAAISKLNIQPGQQVILSCNLGVGAAALYLAFARSGIPAKVYNGSMHELAHRNPGVITEKGQ
ncbi:unnamed protein product [Caenorhabditis auriculariae]|uniref:thiosulfate sulfurtransferase n=1 Tax=Caenorhabditis auriculariae TaxID=2777116 RepID=A0A8S1H2P7_9PELO|nr:unnamed protein product [Caenorhabditis auriculariae]